MNWIKKLNELTYQYPNRRVIFSIAYGVVDNNVLDYNYAERAEVCLDDVLDCSRIDHKLTYSTLFGSEMVFSKSLNTDEILDLLFDWYGVNDDEVLKEYMDALPWEEVIVVSITS